MKFFKNEYPDHTEPATRQLAERLLQEPGTCVLDENAVLIDMDRFVKMIHDDIVLDAIKELAMSKLPDYELRDLLRIVLHADAPAEVPAEKSPEAAPEEAIQSGSSSEDEPVLSAASAAGTEI